MKRIYMTAFLVFASLMLTFCKKNSINGTWKITFEGQRQIAYFDFKDNTCLYTNRQGISPNQTYKFDGTTLSVFNEDTWRIKISKKESNIMIGELSDPRNPPTSKVVLTRVETNVSGNIQGTWRAIVPTDGFTYVFNENGSMSCKSQVSVNTLTNQGSYALENGLLVLKIGADINYEFKVIELTENKLKLVRLYNGEESVYQRQ